MTRLLALLSLTLLLAACDSGGSDPAHNENPTPVASVPPRTPATTPSDATIWTPPPGTTWQWQLSGNLDLSVQAQVWDIDLYDTDAEVVSTLHDRGSKVVCYLSAGTLEKGRPDEAQFPDEIVGLQLEDWPDERWLDVRRLDLLGPIMEARLDQCAAKGFDGVEFDNVDGYANESGFPLTAEDQLRYNRFLAELAHGRGLAAALKNDLDQIAELEPFFDFALNEECFQFDECETLLPFIEAGKAVFHVEYEVATDDFCAQVNALSFSSMLKGWDLDAFREVC